MGEDLRTGLKYYCLNTTDENWLEISKIQYIIKSFRSLEKEQFI